MMLATIMFFTFYVTSLGGIVYLGYIFQRSKEQRYAEGDEKIDPNEIVVLVPFRNEAGRIAGLLESIKALTIRPQNIIFIDDHSNDQTSELIHKSLVGTDYEVLLLPNGVVGKKMAIRFASDQTKSKYILTIDADVELPVDYFTSISSLGDADMYVLPAILKARRFIEHFYEIDLLLVTATNAGLAGWKRPIMASGANLLYKRSTFDKVDNIEAHINSASGDDTYLLRDFRESNADVRLHTNPQCAVTTETPQSLKEFIDQRLRWIGKTGDVRDYLSTTLAVLQAILTLVFFAGLIWTAIGSNWMLFGLLLGFKAFTDLILFFPYCYRVKRLSSWIFIPVYEILFPIYTLILILLLFTYKPKWKGRDIYKLTD